MCSAGHSSKTMHDARATRPLCHRYIRVSHGSLSPRRVLSSFCTLLSVSPSATLAASRPQCFCVTLQCLRKELVTTVRYVYLTWFWLEAHAVRQIDTEPHGISCTFVVPSPPVTPNFATTFSSAQGQKPSKAAMGGSGLKVRDDSRYVQRRLITYPLW